ncbi:hypothetical protein AB0M11_28595 [Streptomyces sp. NPDC051987]|uniref:hypothetical protein n=1 Tax=Streptomyces sp. NPDC051987 TaxID=3155808 RepID=UPI00343AF31E
MELNKHPLIEKLRSLQLPLSDFVVAGSGPLLAHGLREDVGDLDVVARGAAWKLALDLADPVLAPSGHGQMVLLFEGSIEVFDRWLPDGKSPDELIADAEIIEGIPFCSLRDVFDWKVRSGRCKDRLDIELIKGYLRNY